MLHGAQGDAALPSSQSLQTEKWSDGDRSFHNAQPAPISLVAWVCATAQGKGRRKGALPQRLASVRAAGIIDDFGRVCVRDAGEELIDSSVHNNCGIAALVELNS